MKEDELRRSCGTFTREEEYIQKFDTEILRKETTCKKQPYVKRIILNYIFKKLNSIAGAEFSCDSMGTSCGPL
jgi:hypothetical protein